MNCLLSGLHDKEKTPPVCPFSATSLILSPVLPSYKKIYHFEEIFIKPDTTNLPVGASANQKLTVRGETNALHESSMIIHGLLKLVWRTVEKVDGHIIGTGSRSERTIVANGTRVDHLGMADNITNGVSSVKGESMTEATVVVRAAETRGGEGARGDQCKVETAMGCTAPCHHRPQSDACSPSPSIDR